ncbi:MAG: hypothetical protein SV422_14035, partial [Pseudomonadota bacterium]|nr:hypothetical protein [Pseudomonadota bacterium]
GEGRFGDAIGCKRESASRLSSHLDCGEIQGAPIVITTEVPTQPIVVALPAVVITDCEAIIQFEYTQRGALARVEGTIENETCPASSGSFTVSLRTSNDDFEQTTLEFHETWQRDDDEDVNFSRDYAIGDNVDLIGVRTSKSMCKCAAAAE